jgi:hypothetical protein
MSVIPTHRLRDSCETLEKPNGAVADGTASMDVPASTRAPEAWLVDAAARGDVLEIVVVLRGKVQRRSGDPAGLWRVRLPDGHYRVFSPDSVIAATPIAKRAAARARWTPESSTRD